MIAGAAFWIAYAWRRRVEYRRAVLGLVALAAVDYLAHAFANWVEQPDAVLPSDFSVFSLYVLLGALAGLGAAVWYARHAGLPIRTLLDAALVVTVAGAVGARAYHVLTHWDYYGQNPDDITNLAQGGMGLRGALLLGLLALLLFALLSRAPFWKLGDAGALGLALAQSIGWYGAQLVGANYGVVSDAGFAQDLPDVYGIVAPRVPVQWLAVIFFLLLFLALAWLAWRRGTAPGTCLLLYLVLAGLGGFALGAARADETLYVGAWRADQFVDLAFAALGAIGLLARGWRRRAPAAAAVPAP